MTEGIIQKVVNPKIKRLELDLKNAVDRYRNRHEYINDIDLLKELQQELIEEILSTDLMPETWSKPEYSRMLIRLIGDSQ